MGKKRCLAFILSLLLILSTAYATTSKTTESQEIVSQIEDYEEQLENLQKQSKEVSEELYAAQQELLDEREQKALLDEQCSLITQEINLIEENVARVQARIDANEAQEAAQMKLFKSRVRMEEESGITSYISVLFNATSFADFLSRVEFLNELAEYNNSIIDNLHEVRAQLEEDREAIRESEEALQSARDELESLISESENIISGYVTTTAELQEEYDMLEAEELATTELLRAATAMAVQLGIDDVVSSVGGYTWPTTSIRTITSGFGYRTSPGGVGSTNHYGIDLATPEETKVFAAKAGHVTYAGWNGGYGYCVIIQHGQGNTTLYGHLKSITCQVGDSVLQGDLIAYSGNTGTSTGPHLHFGVMENSQWIDPTIYLTGGIYREN